MSYEQYPAQPPNSGEGWKGIAHCSLYFQPQPADIGYTVLHAPELLHAERQDGNEIKYSQTEGQRQALFQAKS